MYKGSTKLVFHLCLIFTCIHQIKTYSQVLSSSSYNNEGPKIYKALNMDLVFPKTFNSSENVISTTSERAPLNATQQSLKVDAQPNKFDIFVTPANNISTNEADSKNSEELTNNSNAETLEENASTGRAVDYRPSYHQLLSPIIKNAPRPVHNERNYMHRPAQSSLGKIVYPQGNQPQPFHRHRVSQAEIQKLGGQSQFSDRFTPSEAVASAHFSSNSKNVKHSSNSQGNGAKTPSATNIVSSYVPPKELYSFPPNSNAKYPSPSEDPKAAIPSGTISSYLPPPSGPLWNAAGYPHSASNGNSNGYKYNAPASSNGNGYKYNGPVNPEYLPPIDGNDGKDQTKNEMGGDDDVGDDSIGVLPASAMDGPNNDDSKNAPPVPVDNNMTDNSENDHHHDDHSHDHDHNHDYHYDHDADHDHPHDHVPDHDHHHDHVPDHDHHHDHPISGYDTDKEYPTPPPGWLEEHPESAQSAPSSDNSDSPPPDDSPPAPKDEHDHHSFDFPEHDFPSFPAYHHYPEIIYDDHFHHHHHIEPPPPPPALPQVTTEAPPPEPPPEPRVKKYSYFYIGRKLWYIPLYFTVWFSFYVLWLILKSIARHKVNLPNHYVARRSINDYNSVKPQEYINLLAVSVLDKIEEFKRKYKTI
ncbi:homeobox protein 2 [Teleopsis dalmanni]|uniref:homeobox protein 2 n=1 Tax=Teleopsis dalmanni TaxID=139649 RepID=UPI0018CDE14E|nr:homeobox protein 2 [Teleopsis dalmanni]